PAGELTAAAAGPDVDLAARGRQHDVGDVVAVHVGERGRRLARYSEVLRVAALQRRVVHRVEELAVLAGVAVGVGCTQAQGPRAARELAGVEEGEGATERLRRGSARDRPPGTRLLAGPELEAPADRRAALRDAPYREAPALRRVPVGRRDVRVGRDAARRHAAHGREGV